MADNYKQTLINAGISLEGAGGAIAPIQTRREAIVAASPTHYWPMIESAGNMLNDVAGTAHLTLTSGFVAVANDTGDNNYYQSGNTGVGETHTGTPLGTGNIAELTLVARIWLDVLDNSIILNTLDNAGNETSFQFHTTPAGGLTENTHPPNLQSISTAAGVLSTGNWIDVACSLSAANNRRRIYVGGALSYEESTVEVFTGVPMTRIVTGYLNGTNPFRLQGRKHHMAVWTRELTQAEIATISATSPT